MWPGSDDLAAGEDGLPPIEALTIEPERSPADIREEVNHLLGVGVRRVHYRPPDRPDISGLRDGLGL